LRRFRLHVRGIARQTSGVALILLALALVLIPMGTAGSAKKTFQVTITPNPAPGGTSVPFSYTIANDATSPNGLGSVDVVLPSGFTLTGLSGAPAGSSPNFGTNTVNLRNLSLAPGAPPLTVTITATTPCTDPGNLKWASYGKQSNDFNGSPGNNFSPYPLNKSQAVTPCKLAFANQPAGTPAKFPVRTTQWGYLRNPQTGDPINVKVVDGSGTDLASPAGSVDVQVSGTGCSFASGATTTGVSFSNGIAAFDNLKLANAATGCTLKAVNSSAGYLDSDPSSSFNVDPVKLFFVFQPKDAAVNSVLRDVKYGGLATPTPAGNPITVGVRVESQTDSSTLQFGGAGTVSMKTQLQSSGCDFTNDSTFSGISFGLDGNATFSNLKMKNVVTAPPGCTLQAYNSSAGYSDSSASNSFKVDQSGVYCPDPNDCTLTVSDGRTFPNSTTLHTSGFDAIALSYFDPNAVVPADVLASGGGCAGYTPPAQGGNSSSAGIGSFDVHPGFTGTPHISVIHTVNKKWVNPSGQPQADLCFGVQRIDFTGDITGTPGTPLPCNSTTQTDATGLGGWITRSGAPAICSPTDGNFWGFLKVGNSDDGSANPQVVNWGNDNNFNRIYTISLGTVISGQDWIWDLKWSP
jgi:hypothetical protein